MRLMETRKNWEKLGQDDPLFAVLTYKDKRGGKWNKQDFFDTGKREVQESINYLNSLGISISPHSALDFGCGVGRLSQALSEYFDEVHGVDIADSMIKLAEEFNHYKTKCKYYVNKNDNLDRKSVV